MIAILIALAARMAVLLVVGVATRKRRRMQRHLAPTFVFADLAGYTELTDRDGDEAAVDAIGSRRDLLPVRVAVPTGSAVMRGCDWYGAAVNVTARLASEAAPNEALVSSASRDADSPPRSGHRELALRGVARPISAWRLV